MFHQRIHLSGVSRFALTKNQLEKDVDNRGVAKHKIQRKRRIEFICPRDSIVDDVMYSLLELWLGLTQPYKISLLGGNCFHL